MSTGPREIDYENFKGDIFGKTFCLTKDETTGEYSFDYAEPPTGFDVSKFKFFRVMGKTTAEVEAELRKILKLAPPTANESGSPGAGRSAGPSPGAGTSPVAGTSDAAEPRVGVLGPASGSVLLPRREGNAANLFEPGIRPPARPPTSAAAAAASSSSAAAGPEMAAIRERLEREEEERRATAEAVRRTANVNAAERLLRGPPPPTSGPSLVAGVGEGNLSAAVAALEGRTSPPARVEAPPPPLSAASSSSTESANRGPPPPPPSSPSSGGKQSRKHKKHSKSKSHKHRK